MSTAPSAYDPRTICANPRGYTPVSVDLTKRPEGWRGAGVYVVIMRTDGPPPCGMAVVCWIDPLTKRGQPRHTHHTNFFKFYQHEVGRDIHVFRIDDLMPPEMRGG